VDERIARPDLGELLRVLATQELLNEFLTRAAAAVRAESVGQITYCALPPEQVDWTRFDVAARSRSAPLPLGTRSINGSSGTGP
jgi:hypothetical protein